MSRNISTIPTPSIEDFRRAAPPRIMGIETEYFTPGVNYDSPEALFEGGQLSMHDYVPPEFLLAKGGMRFDTSREKDGARLRNGGELYLDLDELIESATPECVDAHQLLLYKHANDHIAERAFAAMVERSGIDAQLQQRTGFADIEFDGTIASKQYTVASQENYYSPLKRLYPDAKKRLDAYLNSFLATRPIWSGTGMFLQSGFAISQKEPDVYFGKREELPSFEHTIPYTFRSRNRLEVRLGENNMSRWTTVQKVALTSMVLRLIEHDRFPDSLVIDNPKAAMRMTSFNMPGPVYLHDQKRPMTNIGHQRAIGEAMLKFCDEYDVQGTERQAVDELFTVLEDLEDTDPQRGEISKVHDRVDWAAKLSYCLERGSTAIVNGKINPKITKATFQDDMSWEDAAGGDVAKTWYEQHGQPSLSLEQLPLATPPNTRAAQRDALIQDLQAQGRTIAYTGWDTVKVQDGDDTLLVYVMNDPYGNGPIETRQEEHIIWLG